MTTEQLRAAHCTTPFRPFKIRMADGSEFPIPHLGFLSISPAGMTVIVDQPDGAASILDLLLTTELEWSSPPSEAAAGGERG